jgi:hypothetical protein
MMTTKFTPDCHPSLYKMNSIVSDVHHQKKHPFSEEDKDDSDDEDDSSDDDVDDDNKIHA